MSHFTVAGHGASCVRHCFCCFQLVSTNEALEKDILQLKEGSVTSEAMQSLQDSVRHLQAQNSALQHSITGKCIPWL